MRIIDDYGKSKAARNAPAIQHLEKLTLKRLLMKRTQWLDNIKQSLIVKKSRQRRRSSPSKHLQFSQLEKRNLLATVSFADGGLFFFADPGQEDSVTVDTLDADTLTVSVGNGDSITLSPDTINSGVFELLTSDTLAVDIDAINALSFVLGDGNDFFSSAEVSTDLQISVFAGDGDDVVEGGGSREIVLGGHGDDTISGGGNDDTIAGGFGADSINGGAGDDILDGAESIALPDEPSIVSIATASIGLAQTAQAETIDLSTFEDGDNFGVTFTLFVQNTGDAPLQDVTLLNDFADQLGTAFVSVSSVAVENFSGTGDAPVVNADFAGDTSQSILQGGTTLLPSESFEVSIFVELDSSNTIDSAVSSATATGFFAAANLNVTDVSDSGTATTGLNPDASGDMQTAADPTPVPAQPNLVFVPGAIGLAQTVDVGDGLGNTSTILFGENVQATFTLLIQNTGDEELIDLELINDFADQLGIGGFVSVDSVTLQEFSGEGDAPTINPAFATDTSQNILEAGGTLLPGESFEVVVVLTLAPTESFDTAVSSTVAGTPFDSLTGLTGETISDQSDSGTSTTSINPLAPGDTGGGDDPTPISIDVQSALDASGLGLALTAVPPDTGIAGELFDVTFTVFYANTGDLPLADLELNIDFEALLGSPFVDVTGGVLQNFTGDGVVPTGTEPALNPLFLDDSSLNALDLSSTLEPGDSFEVIFTVVLDPNETVDGATISASATASFDTGFEVGSVSDVSDSGTDTTGTNPGAPGDSGESDDPTPVPASPTFVLTTLPARVTVAIPTTLPVLTQAVFASAEEMVDGDDTIQGGSGNDIIFGDAGNDTLVGGGGDDQISGGEGNDSLLGGNGNDQISGDQGDDFIDGGVGLDSVNGGGGNDTNSFQGGNEGVNVVFTIGESGTAVPTSGIGASEQFTSIESLTGSNFADELIALGSQDTTIRGLGGDDIIQSGTGNDLLVGNDGADILRSGAGNDSAFGGPGNDTLNGGAGDDLLNGQDGDDFLIGLSGVDEVIGGNGSDTISFQDSTVGVTVSAFGTAVGTVAFAGANLEQFFTVENITGTPQDDSLSVFSSADTVLQGLGGDDVLTSGFGNDTLLGGAGNDILRSGFGDDSLFGGQGSDALNAGAGDDTLAGAGGEDFFQGGAGDDSLFGGAGNDVLNGGAGDDLINGNAGDDFLIGGSGLDLVLGATGFDTISFEGSGQSVTATLASNGNGSAQQSGQGDDFFSGIEVLRGSEFDDVLTALGLVGRNIFGLGGNDQILGSFGDDLILGGNGDDIIDGRAGADSVFGNAGDDDLIGGLGDDLVLGGEGLDDVTDFFGNNFTQD